VRILKTEDIRKLYFHQLDGYRNVVPIPFWLYVIFVLVVIGLAGTAIQFAMAAIFIYFLFTAPRETFGFILLVLAFKYWMIALPKAVIAGIVHLATGSREP
jgi:hypothetical protein